MPNWAARPVSSRQTGQKHLDRTMVDTSMAVELSRVTKRFGAVRALAGVDASFAASRVAVLTGGNGSGKSTLLAIVGTLARATAGDVNHGDIGRDVREVRANLGWVGHETLAYGDLTGRENIVLTARIHGLRPAQALDEAIERFALAAFVDRLVRTYSRGQRQRVALARALLHHPALLLLDEPTAGLDAASTANLARVVREEALHGATVILSTHDPSLTDDVGDDIWLLDRGRLEKEARPRRFT
jgi:ABC-type multidrug transport system ATPase subunit